MKTGTRGTSPAAFVSLFFLVLAGIGFDAQAQSSKQDCPDIPGISIDDPDVTVQQVEDGKATLEEFVLSARKDFKKALAAGRATGLYLGCRIRQEGEPWRSGSTYLVQLAPTGRVFLHAKDMALSGNLLKFGIRTAILASLLPDVDLTNQTAVLNGLLQEPTARIMGIPGVSGYASAYMGAAGTPIILLAGFDLNDTHLETESIDYGDPTIRAQDVVNRETLKAFVANAIEQFREFGRTGGRDSLSKAKVAFRDPDGPWRHGSVYLYILDRSSNIILFHGAFPDEFEVRPLRATRRDAVTGELILEQVLDAAESSPEGGFVQYYFDDPADDTDSADIPKVGYAREFEVTRANGRIDRYVIGSGFYLSDPGVTAYRKNLAIETIQPQVMRAMTASTVDAVSNRIERAIADDASQAASLSFGGSASSLSDALLAHGESLESGSFDLAQLLAGSSFTLPLNAADTAGGWFRNLTIWGSGDYRDFSGGDRQVMRYEGDVVSLSFGMDARVGTDMLAGMSVARTKAEVDYDDVDGGKGESTTTLTSVNPYLGWQVDSCINVWAMAGYGWGDIQVDDAAATQESDLEQQMVAAGISGLLVSRDDVIKGGTTTVRVKAEAAYTWADIDGEGTLESRTLDANRSRLMLEGTHIQPLDSGATFTSSLEVGVRHDGGDGEDGESVETGGSVRYAHPASGVSIETRARALLGHDGDYDEWGISGLVQLDPGADGVGLALSVEPQWGQTKSGIQQLWEADTIGGASLANPATARMNARIAYGFVAMWAGRQGVLTPYTDVSLSGEGSQRLSVGGLFNVGSSMNMSLEVMHDQPAHGDSGHGIMLRSNFNW